METEIINEHLHKHQEAIEDWQFSNLSRELHRWVQIFVFEFKLQIPKPVLSIDRIRATTMGQFYMNRSGFGTQDTIVLNTVYVHGELWIVLSILLHELLHEWQKYHGKPSRSAWFHNKRFREKAKLCGLLVDKGGYDMGYTEIFRQLLAKHGVNISEIPSEARKLLCAVSPKIASKSKLHKWSCRCHSPVNTWCAVILDATCNRCGHKFELNDKRVRSSRSSPKQLQQEGNQCSIT